MSAYLARLKKPEDAKNYHYAPDTLPPKPPEPHFAGFDGTGARHIVKILLLAYRHGVSVIQKLAGAE
jgi:hypothetical protein